VRSLSGDPHSGPGEFARDRDTCRRCAVDRLLAIRGHEVRASADFARSFERHAQRDLALTWTGAWDRRCGPTSTQPWSTTPSIATRTSHGSSRHTRFGKRAQQPLGEIDQLTPLARDPVQAGSGRPSPGPDRLLMCRSPLVGSALTRFDETAHRNVRLARRLTFRRVASSYC
jgi:hypothetical protein